MFARLDSSPPRLSDMYGEARLDALYRRAAADRARPVDDDEGERLAGATIHAAALSS